MAITKSRTYLDTSASGLIFVVEHNLGGVPDLFFTELVAGQQVYVSLMDARIAEVKSLDEDNIQVTFAASFAGYLELLLVEVDDPSDHERLLGLEERYVNQVALLEDKVSKSQWIQMNNLFSAQIEGLQGQVADLQSQINILEADVSTL